VNRPFVGALEGLRGYAALLMVVYHAWVLTGGPRLGGAGTLLSGGFLAVDLFFVLSAFVLLMPAAISGSFGSWREYARRRAARILPAYYAALAVALVAFHALAGPAADRRPPTLDAVAAHATFLQVEARLFGGYDGALGFRVNPVLWTLSVEVAFYAALPLIALGFLRRPRLWLVVALAGTLALRALALQAPSTTADRLLSLPPMFASDFAAGMAGAWLYARGVRPRGWFAALALAASIAVLWAAGNADAGAARLGARQSLWLPLAVSVAFGALVLAAPGRALADNRVARWLGKVSYGVFLFHFMVMLACLNALGFERGTNRDFAVLLAAGLAGSLAAGYASWRLVEQPVRSRARHVRRQIVA
jgi:peptidoglycan/LPS O-acetylase OafA/YrhL